MLPTGPLSTYQLPSTTAPGDRELARQILASIRQENTKAQEVRTGLMSTGCDGEPTINPLDGTSCNPGDVVVLFNPQSRKVLGTLGTPAAAGPSSLVTAPASCDVVRAMLKTRRRFVDNLGNVYGPDGGWLGGERHAPAVLETEYVHLCEIGKAWKSGEGGRWVPTSRLSLVKTSGMAARGVLISNAYGDGGAGVAQGMFWPSTNDDASAGVVTLHTGYTDHYDAGGTLQTYTTWHLDGLDDVQFSGAYEGTSYLATVQIVPTVTLAGPAGPTFLDGLGHPANPADVARLYTGDGPCVWDIECTASVPSGPSFINTYRVRRNGGAWGADSPVNDGLLGPSFAEFDPVYPYPSNVGKAWTITVLYGDAAARRPDSFYWYVTSGSSGVLSITADPVNPQALGHGISVTFGSKYGHARGRGNPLGPPTGDTWSGSLAPSNRVRRPGVAARGQVKTATACINGGSPNSNVILTAEMLAAFPAVGSPTGSGSHALVVRNADTLEQLYRKGLLYNGTPLNFTAPQLFSFSTNDEGLFFLHAYTVPTLTSPPTPFPGAEFGSPDARKIAVVSVDPTTFEPTILELITLESNGRTTGSTFAVAITLP